MYKLVCFDVDGTLIDNTASILHVFHRHFRVDERIRNDAIRGYKSGKITYEEWAMHDVMLWHKMGKQRSDFISAMVSSKLRLMDGAMDTLSALRKRGMKLVIISGSISIVLEHLLPRYQEIFDDVFISHIHFDDKGGISSLKATEYDMEGKATALRKVALKHGVSVNECVFVGDNTNDVGVAKEAVLSIAFNPKDKSLVEASDIVITCADISRILPH